MTAMRWLPATDCGWWEKSHKIRQMSGFCWTVCVRFEVRCRRCAITQRMSLPVMAGDTAKLNGTH